MPGLRTGGVLKRSTRADCKSAGYAYVGSNPTPSTRRWCDWEDSVSIRQRDEIDMINDIQTVYKSRLSGFLYAE